MVENLSIRDHFHVKEFLDEKYAQYNNSAFISSDPIQVPHLYSRKEDIEIAAFLTATLAWGQRQTIIRNARILMEMMPGGPFHFISHLEDHDMNDFLRFAHRTFNGFDCIYFLKSLQHIYHNHGGLEEVFCYGYSRQGTIFGALDFFRKVFFEKADPERSSKHVSDVTRNSAAKRLNMFLRWMVRSDTREVDFGLWKEIPSSELMIPLDLHSGNTARKLGLLVRKQNDWKAVEELTSVLKAFDENDPVKYDYALFGLGVFEKF